MKRRREEAERQAETARMEISPARRMFPGAEEELQQARQKKPEPEPQPAADEKAQQAERMKLQPSGLQRAPSLGGGSYVNSLSQRPALDADKEKESTKQSQGQESLFEAARRRAEETRAMQDQQRNRPLERLYPDLMQQR